MTSRRLTHFLILVSLLLSGVLVHPPAARAVGGWAPAPPRGATGWPVGSATTLPDGRALVISLIPSCASGCGATDLYDPATNRWSRGAPLDAYGGLAAPVVLGDGRILFTAGWWCGGISPGSCGSLNRAQVYDPAADAWTAVAPLSMARGRHTATRLADGTVLVVGGTVSQGSAPSQPTATVERYDPRANRWSPAAPLLAPRGYHGAALLRDGRVLVFGGATTPPGTPYGAVPVTTAELYDPTVDRWTPAASLAAPRAYDQRAVTLADGRVLVIGSENGTSNTTLSAEVYDPATNRWTPATPPSSAGTLTLLPNGWVLATGAVTQLYDPARNVWADAAPSADPTAGVATLLADGRVLLVGDRSAELYSADPAPTACFAATGYCVSGRFLDYWQQHGGLAINGYPLSDLRVEVLEDGQAHQVQYFERVRMEYHPRNATPYDVLLGQFGRRMLRTGVLASPFITNRAAPRSGLAYFPETGHNLGGGFLVYWQANGGLAQFGYPLSEEFTEQLEDGNSYTVQYFERARFEYHPENPPPYDILLGHFGWRILTDAQLLADAPTFNRLYLTSERLQEQVGHPVAPVVRTPGGYLGFERGVMFWRGDTREITVLCGGDQRAGDDVLGPFADTWREGEAPGGGPGPRSGLYEPTRGFGKLWRENAEVRDCLGYATDARETSYALTVQPFRRMSFDNLLIAVETPAGRFIYAIYRDFLGSSACISRPSLCRPDYERYAEPSP